jgi:F-type H+-transporting ATPase subunit b
MRFMLDLVMLAEASHGEAHAAPALFGLDATVWVSLAMAGFLAIIVWKKVPAMIAAMLDAKIAEIRTQLDEAAALRTQAEALKAEYEGKLAAADKDAAEMRARAETEAATIVDKAKADAASLITRRKKMAEDRIAAAEASAVADVRARAVAAATAAAASLIAAKHDAATDKALVDGAIKAIAD